MLKNLVAKMAEVNKSKKLTRVVPSEKLVEGSVEQEKTLLLFIHQPVDIKNDVSIGKFPIH